mmetsp:Transcript_25802/g.44049  ORF Transcript_25802/g.44049 Transcript_25802/m.44049 type:complete len:361 (-) Transcript_25802:87-1169(-)|eukprot:CAMPEP_0183767522 /NCGR_PEP_ID=MMETSP0739-20130205/12239_1 /TAXON_ID=385413 /ORGANISM="Thalassiosira miniscula, Strain CCMP1093" /LENGTH=360 /DNA_ID=CAMNT_0026006433 /DNA_START=14 /DNA_END=1096 /DNA_ORIENTATION=+
MAFLTSKPRGIWHSFLAILGSWVLVITGALLERGYHVTHMAMSSIDLKGTVTYYSRSLAAQEDERGVIMSDEEFSLFSPMSGDKNWLYSNQSSRVVTASHAVVSVETMTINGVETKIKTRSPRQLLPHKSTKIPTHQYVLEKVLERHNGVMPSPSTNIDRVYYINVEKNYERRFLMESWLNQTNLPFERAPGLAGQTDSCVDEKNGPHCIGISGLIRSNFNIMDNLNTEGITLVVEDDFVVRDMKKLILSTHLVPDDWDVLRWDCYGTQPPEFEWLSEFSFEVGPLNQTFCAPCAYCGGTHAVMWRGDGDSLKKLRDVWSQQPYNDIDCRLSDPSLKSYCINVGVGEFRAPRDNRSDIKK